MIRDEHEAREAAETISTALANMAGRTQALYELAAGCACAAPNVAVVDGVAYFDGDDPW